MKRLDNMWVVIALFCSLLLTACTADNMDNPSVSPEEMPVVNDMMDTSVKPGEDFFRYCNCKWNDGVTVDLETAEIRSQYYGFFPTEILQMFNKNLSELDYPSMKVISRHFESAGADLVRCVQV